MKYPSLTIFLYLVFSVQNFAQNQTSILIDHDADHPSYKESLYLHTNSSFLLVGETLLFKALCLNSNSHTLSGLSTVAYIEVIDAHASPVLQTKILLRNGSGAGDFYLPSTLTSGNYTLIAYTHWMRSYPTQDFFKKQITIINPFRKPVNALQDKKSELKIDFFPEGGSLITGVSTSIGYKIQSENKLDTNFTGKVIDEQGNVISEFIPSDNGIGSFSMKPMAGKAYKAIIMDSRQNIHFQSLPISVDSGIAMHVIEEEDAFQINLVWKGNEKKGKAKIIAHSNDQRIFDVNVQFEGEDASCKIKKASLPLGVSQLTVSTNRGDVAAHCFIFHALSKSPALQLTLEKARYQTRQKVVATINVRDTLLFNVSVSVRKVEKQINDQSTLSGQLFFNNLGIDIDPLDKKSIWDNMLVRRGVPYEEVKSKTKLIMPRYLPEVRNNLITGKVKNQYDSNVSQERVYLSIPAKEYLFFASITDSTGRFYFNTDKIKFNTDIILQVAPTCTLCRIELDHNELEDYSAFMPGPLYIDTSFQKIIEQRSIQAQIENAYYLKKQDSILSKPANHRFYGQPDKTYFLDDYVRFPTMEDILIEYIPEIVLKKKKKDFELRVLDIRKQTALDEEPLILLDGIPIFDISQVMTYDPLLLSKIEIVGRRYIYGPLKAPGIVSLTTYDGNAKDISLPKKEKYLGIQPRKSYYSPTYGEASSLTTIPDFRNQLYWNPEITISSKSLSFEFYTSDVAGDFEIVIQGVREDGWPIQCREIIHVDTR